jgi:hypothetical protein
MIGRVIWATDTQIKQLIDDTRQVMAETRQVIAEAKAVRETAMMVRAKMLRENAAHQAVKPSGPDEQSQVTSEQTTDARPSN